MGTTLGSRVKAPNIGGHKQLNLGHADKYPHKAAIPGPTKQTHRLKSKVLSPGVQGPGVQGSKNACAGQRLAPHDLEGVFETSPRNSLPKEEDESAKTSCILGVAAPLPMCL